MMLDVCTVCHKPATGSMNVMASAAGSAPSRFERRCDKHNAYRFQLATATDLDATRTERDRAVADAARWRGHHRHAGKVIARLQRAIQTYWSACHAEQAVADADDWSPDAAHEAALATQEARDGLWLALDLPSPWTTDAAASPTAPAADPAANAGATEAP